MSEAPVWMEGLVDRVKQLEQAIAVHRQLVHEAEANSGTWISREAADRALWAIADGFKVGCNGGCCG